jgi:hypothetical protein
VTNEVCDKMCDKSTLIRCKEEEERINIAGTGKRKIQQ